MINLNNYYKKGREAMFKEAYHAMLFLEHYNDNDDDYEKNFNVLFQYCVLLEKELRYLRREINDLQNNPGAKW